MNSILSQLHINTKNKGTWLGAHPITCTQTNYIKSYSPIDDSFLAEVNTTSTVNFDATLKAAKEAFEIWRTVPAPKRGEIVRQIGEAFRHQKKELGKLISLEMGKSIQEGYGEVQEVIDICDFAVGLSRSIHGKTFFSERPNHRMYEQWHPIGIVGIITAFNFPMAVWSWNAIIAFVCGNVCIWKPSEKTPLCAIACQKIVGDILKKNKLPSAISCLINGDKQIGEWIAKAPEINLVSATGSTLMGKQVAKTVAKRLGKSLLELGGNNAMIITPNCNLQNSLPAIVFGAIGTAGQRCTSTRRLIVHESKIKELKKHITHAYTQIKVGSPFDEAMHMGPLIDDKSVLNYLQTIEACRKQKGTFWVEGKTLSHLGDCYVTPAIVEIKADASIVQQETFAPILYIISYKTIEEAISIQNNVPQGLSSAILSENIKEIETFLSYEGSDCGIANVNIGTSGAEIGGAFGGEKETGGGRESGSDSWKNYS